MSQFTYNGVTVKDCLLQAIDQAPVYNEANTDPIAIRTTMVIRGLIQVNEDLGAVRIGTPVTTHLGDARSVMRRLSEPRKRFTFEISPGVTLFDISPDGVPENTAPQDGGEKDLNNGPRPTVRVDSIRGRRSMGIVFAIEFWTWTCAEANNVLNLRYYCTEDIDEDWYRTIQYQGTLRLRSRIQNPHNLRGLTLPPLQGGFKRVAMNFSESPDGLSLSFRIADRQTYAAPPFPATTWRGSFDVIANEGTKVVESVNVTLSGPPHVAKADLLNVAFRIIDTKLNLLANIGGEETAVVIEEAHFSESLERNEITASMRVFHAKDPLERLLAIGNDNFGKPLPGSVALDGNYDPHRHQFPVFPNATLAGLFTSAIQDPCHPAAMSGTQVSVTIEDPDETEGSEAEAPGDGDIGDLVENLLDSQAQRSIYYNYQISSTLEQKTGVHILPLSAVVNNQYVAPIQFHGGIAYRTIRVVAERIGLPPELPAPLNFTDPINGIEHILLEFETEASGTRLAADGISRIHYVRMRIKYGLSRPTGPNDSIYTATMPYDKLTLETNFLPATVFVPPGNVNSLA